MQQKEKEKATQPAASGGGWGGGFFSNNNAIQQELEKVQNDLEVAQEELEAKMSENCKYLKAKSRKDLLSIGGPLTVTTFVPAMILRLYAFDFSTRLVLFRALA